MTKTVSVTLYDREDEDDEQELKERKERNRNSFPPHFVLPRDERFVAVGQTVATESIRNNELLTDKMITVVKAARSPEDAVQDAAMEFSDRTFGYARSVTYENLEKEV